MPRIRNLPIQTDRIKDHDFIVVDRNTTPIRLSGAVYKIGLNNVIYSPIIYFLSGNTYATTRGELYILSDQIFTASGVTSLSIKTFDGIDSSELLWMEKVTGMPNKVVVYSSLGFEEYAEGDATSLTSPLVLESPFGLFPNTSTIPYQNKSLMSGISLLSGE